MVTGSGGLKSRKSAGDEAEALALAHLQRHGLRLLQRNYRVAAGPSAHAGEIDLIMCEPDGTVVFVEVRMRRDSSFGGPAASVTRSKQRRVSYAARRYLLGMAAMPPCRFDVVAIEGARIEWIKAAFESAG
jgi:putative endonuclease